jgi:enamine deaminase RidA (YjgF/YER057c/UK114 family)
VLCQTLALGDVVLLTVAPGPSGWRSESDLRRAYWAFAEQLRAADATLLLERVYGERSAAERVATARAAVYSERGECAAAPFTFVEGAGFAPGGVTGIHAVAIRASGGIVSISLPGGGPVCGRIVRGREAEYLGASDLGRALPAVHQQVAEAEVRAVLGQAESLLAEAGWSFADVRRTWFFLRDITSWYCAFNTVRNCVFTDLGLVVDNTAELLPASTGIGGVGARGSWCTLDLLAMRALAGQPLRMARLHSPSQNEATEYGSAFCRGLQVATASGSLVLISGTAAIDGHGSSVHVGELERQARTTVAAVQALLAGVGAGLDAIAQATVYIKPAVAPTDLAALLGRIGLAAVPLLAVHADVCRAELLFEMDATALVPASASDGVC